MSFHEDIEGKNANADYWMQIWDKFRSGDHNAFSIIYNEYIERLFAYGIKITTNRELVKDAIQDIFINAYTYGKKLQAPEYLEFYLFKSLKNNILHKLSKENMFSKKEYKQINFEINFPIEDNDIEQKYKKEEKYLLLQKEINNLNAEKREILFLKFNSGLTYKEIGLLFGLNHETVKKQVQRVLSFLRKKIEAELTE